MSLLGTHYQYCKSIFLFVNRDLFKVCKTSHSRFPRIPSTSIQDIFLLKRKKEGRCPLLERILGHTREPISTVIAPILARSHDVTEKEASLEYHTFRSILSSPFYCLGGGGSQPPPTPLFGPSGSSHRCRTRMFVSLLEPRYEHGNSVLLFVDISALRSKHDNYPIFRNQIFRAHRFDIGR